MQTAIVDPGSGPHEVRASFGHYDRPERFAAMRRALANPSSGISPAANTRLETAMDRAQKAESIE
ncbi:MAG: hypothetical protein U1E18_31975, partial [Brevundimonas sp.]|uniref:hypothetical protein n=1 Tax=Brevundimonas sp. TaxID=1871086 RepID=UPI002ABB548A